MSCPLKREWHRGNSGENNTPRTVRKRYTEAPTTTRDCIFFLSVSCRSVGRLCTKVHQSPFPSTDPLLLQFNVILVNRRTAVDLNGLQKRTHNPLVASSNPAGPTSSKRGRELRDNDPWFDGAKRRKDRRRRVAQRCRECGTNPAGPTGLLIHDLGRYVRINRKTRPDPVRCL